MFASISSLNEFGGGEIEPRVEGDLVDHGGLQVVVFLGRITRFIRELNQARSYVSICITLWIKENQHETHNYYGR